MMKQEYQDPAAAGHPITPPPELVQEWQMSLDCPDGIKAKAQYIATQAARWGYQQCADEIAAETERRWLDGETD